MAPSSRPRPPSCFSTLFFDLGYVFAITQLSQLILDDLSVAGLARAASLLMIVWWAWIYTTWMANWFDPGSPAVRSILTAAMLVSLLMAAALPGAFADDGVLFAVSYVTLQVGRNVAAVRLLRKDHPLRDVFERLVGWSVVSGVLWLAGSTLDGDERLLLWVPAILLDLCAPFAGYWMPRRGRAATTDYDIEGGHFTERCEGCDDPGRLARDAYTYLHVPIVAGTIAVAVGDDLLIAEPGQAAHGVGLAVVLGGPVLFLVGESVFRMRVTGAATAKRFAVAGLLVLLAPVAAHVSALALSVMVGALLIGLALWESPQAARPARSASGWFATQQQEAGR